MKKEADFLKSLDLQFNITVESRRTSSLVMEEDQDFLLNKWDKTIPSIRDKKTKQLVKDSQTDSSSNVSMDTEEKYKPKRI